MVDISIEANDGFAQQIFSAAQTTGDFDFPIFAKSHIQVIRTRAGVRTVMVLDGGGATGYTVPDASVNDEDGGTIELAVGATNGDVITMRLNVPEARTTDFQQTGDFFAATLNRELDLQTQMLQQLRRDLARAAHLADDSTITSVILPDPEDTKVLAWDGTDGTMQNGPTIGEISAAGSYATAAAASATAADGSADDAQGYADDAAARATVTVSGNKTLALSDVDTFQRCTGTATVTIPANATVAFAVDDEMDFFNSGSATNLTMTAAANVIVNGQTAKSIVLPPYTGGTLKKAATNTWDWIGYAADGWA